MTEFLHIYQHIHDMCDTHVTQEDPSHTSLQTGSPRAAAHGKDTLTAFHQAGQLLSTDSIHTNRQDTEPKAHSTRQCLPHTPKHHQRTFPPLPPSTPHTLGDTAPPAAMRATQEGLSLQLHESEFSKFSSEN